MSSKNLNSYRVGMRSGYGLRGLIKRNFKGQRAGLPEGNPFQNLASCSIDAFWMLRALHCEGLRGVRPDPSHAPIEVPQLHQ